MSTKKQRAEAFKKGLEDSDWAKLKRGSKKAYEEVSKAVGNFFNDDKKTNKKEVMPTERE